jgi:hypothetical protein
MAKTPDWEAIEAAYRAGLLSIRAIAEQYGTKESTIRSKAQKKGWQRNLSKQVRSTAKTKLSRTTSRNSFAQETARSDEEIVEEAADEITQVVLGHRQQINDWKGIAAKLAVTLSQVDVDESNHNEFARSLNSGVDALGKVIKLERQAYSMDDDDKADETAERSLTDDELEARIAKLQQQVGGEQ